MTNEIKLAIIAFAGTLFGELSGCDLSILGL